MSIVADIEAHAREAAGLLRLLAHDRRLLLLCHLLQEGEVTVGTLAARLGLSQPAMSQHLQRLRDDGLVATRRTGTTVHYRIADPRLVRLLGALRDVFCSSGPIPSTVQDPQDQP
ncbi:helix-turn-helix transcriptional regulator [Roseomonas eburnea]|uniref:Helix-turn-helix transcriptional regulator n=1 Tax=Neoroseomonas eburnea TaxID=1346889 RepID=A0A9X9XKF8_9PROT|nr:metalloregulator ArsR/SmtB family transcription factor [Neoroseomonas eburnea]MBR0684194.1 helix-turn-helix transcriptional regulator [Neoroseomonas eburnea]